MKLIIPFIISVEEPNFKLQFRHLSDEIEVFLLKEDRVKGGKENLDDDVSQSDLLLLTLMIMMTFPGTNGAGLTCSGRRNVTVR